MKSPKDDSADDHDESRDQLENTIGRVIGGLSKMFNGNATEEDAPEKQKQKPEPLPAAVEAFFKAVRTNRPDLVTKYLNEGVSPDVIDKNGDTGLLLCARAGNDMAAEVLLAVGADPTKLSKKGSKTPIEEAVNFGKSGMVLLLAKHGGYVAETYAEGRSLIHRACEKGRADIVKALMDAGANGNEPTDNGATPLIMAIQLKRGEVADTLLDDKNVAMGINFFHANTDEYRRSAFQLAVEKGNPQTVGKMLTLGAFVNLPDATGETPMIKAIAQGNLSLIKTLARAGADLNRDDTPLVFACHTPELRNEARRAEVVSLLISLGADPDQRDPETGMRPLHAAALSQSGRQALNALLRANASPDVHDDDGFTPLFYTLHKSTPDAMKAFVKAGANINALHKEDGRTALIQAVREKSPAMVGALLESGANPAIMDTHGKTALFYAHEDKQERIVELLQKKPLRRIDSKTGGQKP